MSKATEIPEDERIYITQAADLLNRRMGTLRKWESSGVLPKQLHPRRGLRGRRYWSSSQIQGMKDWIEDTDRRPGRGIHHIDKQNSDPEKVRQQIEAMRRPRGFKKTPTER